MTERSPGDDRDYPDGSVGRYVRERWGTLPSRTPPSGNQPVPERTLPVMPAAPADSSPNGSGPAAGIPRSHAVPDGERTSDAQAKPPQPWRSSRAGPRTHGWTDPAAVAAQEAQQARSGSDQRRQETTDLSSARLLRQTPRPPQSGWRLAVYKMSGRLINPGESPSDVRRRELTARLNTPLLGCYKIAMLSLKGGVGKTTVTATLGATFASLRGDRVVAVDANPDRGTLSQKIPLETSATVRHLLRDAQRVRRYTDVRAYTSQGPSRLEVLASEQDPAVSESFSEEDYRRTIALLEHFYNIVLTDCGTGL
ncbi:MAG TPA: MinD/ParA family protein, partial [Pseudonocardia sp.]